MPVYETGHALNVAHFQQLISFVDSWGAPYAPTNASIALTALNTKLTDAQSAIGEVINAVAASKTAINDRENLFEPVNRLVTRVVNFYESTGAEQNQIDDVRSLKKKLDGTRSKPVVDDPNTPEDESQNSISSSQQSYTQKVQHLDGIIELLGGDVLYAPSEVPLKLGTLNTLSTSLKAANTSVIDASTAISNKRGDRDTVMYAGDSGLVDLALLVKKYVKAAFGTSSVQYSQISGLSFTRPKS